MRAWVLAGVVGAAPLAFAAEAGRADAEREAQTLSGALSELVGRFARMDKKMLRAAALKLRAFNGEMAEMLLVEQDANTRARLGVARTELSIYYVRNGNAYPRQPSSVPVLYLREHDSGREVRTLKKVRSRPDLERQLINSGRWTYVADPASKLFGTLLIDCSHDDGQGQPWSKL